MEVSEYIISGNYSKLKGNMMRLLSQCVPDADMQYPSYVAYTRNQSLALMPILKFLQSVQLASYNLRGGENAEVVVRINDPEKLKRLANSNYQNSLLRVLHRKHSESQNLMRQFFTSTMSDERRWDFIESYFLGREEELEQYLGEAREQTS